MMMVMMIDDDDIAGAVGQNRSWPMLTVLSRWQLYMFLPHFR